jgi:hypothetical protein
MAGSRKPGILETQPLCSLFPWRTPGPLGYMDGGEPFADAFLGDAPGPTGVHDHATPLKPKAKKKKTHTKKPKHHTEPLRAAFDRARKLGWLPFFKDAADKYRFTPELLMAISYRESGLNPKYLQEAGDNGHGYGLMQADIRSYKEWIDSGKWKDARECIFKGAEVLDSKRTEIKNLQKKEITVKTLAGQKYTFVGKEITEPDLLRVAVAAYNCGLWAYYHYSKGHDIDRGTTGQNYSRDVLAHTAQLKELLEAEQNQPKPTAMPQWWQPPDYYGEWAYA